MTPQHQPQPLAEHDVTAAARDLVLAFSRTDTDAYFAAFAPEATFVFHPEDRRVESRAEYEALWKTWLAGDWSVTACESSEARVQLFGSTAVFSHTVHTTTSTGGTEETTVERETIVFARIDGRILAVHEHLSPSPAAAGSTA